MLPDVGTVDEGQSRLGQGGKDVEGEGERVKQYCRYCANCFLQDDDIVYCQPKNEMREKRECVRANHCKHFELNPYDVFSMDADGNFKEYKPREPYKPRIVQAHEAGQIDLLEAKDD